MSVKLTSSETTINKSATAASVSTKNKILVAPWSSTYAKVQPLASSNVVSTLTDYASTIPITITSVAIQTVYVTDSNWNILDDTALSSAGGYLKITGLGFQSGCLVYIQGIAASSVTFISANEIRVQTPVITAGTNLHLYVVNPDNSVAIKLTGLTVSGVPNWITTSPLGTQVTDVPISINLSANSDSTITYTLQSGSSLPPGISLSSTGVLSGTVTGLTAETLYSFNVVATDLELQDTAKTFSVTISLGDVYFSNTVFLLSGTVGSNTWIKDSSNNSFQVGIMGDTKPSSFSPFSQNWSVYFDGISAYYDFTANTTFNNFGTGDFTVEGWVYWRGTDNFSGNPTVMSVVSTWSTAVAWEIEVQSGGVVRFAAGDNLPIDLKSSGAQLITPAKWYHIAASRSSGTTKLFVNGVTAGTHTGSVSINQNVALRLGAFPGGGNRWTGYISNVRVVKGQALYTNDFTPSTTGLTLTSQGVTSPTVFLTCNSYQFADANTTPIPTTNGGFNGNPQVKSFSPFSETLTANGSAYFDGSGDYLTVPANTAFTLGTNDHCIEFWMYPDGSQNQYACPWYYNGSIVYYYSIGSNAPAVTTLLVGGGAPWTLSISTANAEYAKMLSSWSHIVITRSGSAFRLFINGILRAYGTASTNITSQTSPFYIGWDGVTAGTTYFKGYLSNFKIINGSIPNEYQTSTTTLDTKIFTPPTTRASVTSNTVYLGLQDRLGDNNQRFVDESANTNLIIRGGNVSQGSFTPFNPAGWSTYFDGTNWMQFADNYNAPGAGVDFCHEFWFYCTSTPVDTTNTIWSDYYYGDGNQCSSISDFNASGICSYSFLVPSGVTGGAVSNPVASPLQYNKWYHVAFTRNGATLNMFVNGNLANTVSCSTAALQNSSKGPKIGSGDSISSTIFYPFSGYISNMRITHGNPVYTGNFAVPTSPLANTQSSSTNINAITSGQCRLLTCNDYVHRDNSGNTLYQLTMNQDYRWVPQRVVPFSPFKGTIGGYTPSANAGSAFFDGTGDYLQGGGNASLIPMPSLGTFTVEGWIYPTGAASVQRTIIGDVNPTGTTFNIGVRLNSSNKIEFYWYDGAAKTCASNTAIQFNCWNYFAVVANSNTINVYVNSANAERSGTSTLTTRSFGALTGFGLGSFNNGDPFIGYMSSIRWSNGIARNITAVPTAPHTADANTNLLLNFTNGSVIDYRNSIVLETVGDSRLSSNTSKYSNSSIYFDGTGDYLRSSNTAPHFILNGDFTIETWVNINQAVPSGMQAFITTISNASALYGFRLGLDNSGRKAIFYIHNNATIQANVQGVSVLSTNTWYHIAATRQGTNCRLFVNGTLEASANSAQNTSPSLALSVPACIGSGQYANDPTTNPFNGYLADLRLTQGLARYTNNFTVPDRVFPSR